MIFDDAASRGLARVSPPSGATPFLALDQVRVQRNIAAMQARARAAGVELRPHVKTHKSIVLARLQVAAGAVGITASKPSEALVFVEAGIRSVTLAYPIVRANALDTLLETARSHVAELQFIAAGEHGVRALEAAALRHRTVLPVFMKVDIGLGRIGVKPASDNAVAVARMIDSSGPLRFAGLLSHAGHAYGAAGPEDIRRVARQEAADLNALKLRLTAEGIDVRRISVGATPTCLGAPLPPDVDEIRPGNYIFLDGTALRLGICTPDDLALSVIATVVFHNGPHAIIDAGTKVMSSDRGPHGTGGSGYGIVTLADTGDGRVWSIEKMSEEHGFICCDEADLPVGSRVRIFPNHACAVVSLFDQYRAVSGVDGDAPMIAVDARGRFE